MRKTAHIISASRALQVRAVTALPLIIGIIMAFPTSTTAQVATCVDCIESPFAPGSTVCAFEFEGYQNCETTGTPLYHVCSGYGGPCDPETTEEADQEATTMVLRGEMLPANGNYFFMLEGRYAVVMRKCDRSVVARVPTGPDRRANHHPIVGPHLVERSEVAHDLATSQ